jgi:26S proteasome regulatory subunit N3
MAAEATPVAASAPEASPATLEDKLKAVVGLVAKSVKSKDTRLLLGRLLRQTARLRKQLTVQGVKAFLQQTLPDDLESRALLLAAVDQVEVRPEGHACATVALRPAGPSPGLAIPHLLPAGTIHEYG